jgi:hypothetical protein
MELRYYSNDGTATVAGWYNDGRILAFEWGEVEKAWSPIHWVNVMKLAPIAMVAFKQIYPDVSPPTEWPPED